MNERIVRVVTTFLLVAVPVLFVGNVFQAFRFSRIQSQVENSREAVFETIEENKRLIAGIASLRSPSRIRLIAQDQLQMRPVRASDIIRIQIPGGERVP